MRKNLKGISYFVIFFSILFVLTGICAAQSGSVEIKDIEKLEKYETRVIKRLTGKEYVTPLEERITLKVKIFGGPGMIMPVGSDYQEAFHSIGLIVNVGAYFNLSSMKSTFLKNFFISLELGFIYLGAYSRNTIIQGAQTINQEIDDGSLLMIPIYLGVLYQFELFENFYLSPAVAFGFSYNTLSLPSKIDSATGNTGYEGSSTLLTFKAGADIRYELFKDFSIEGSLGFMGLLESSLVSFFYFSVWVNYKF